MTLVSEDTYRRPDPDDPEEHDDPDDHFSESGFSKSDFSDVTLVSEETYQRHH